MTEEYLILQCPACERDVKLRSDSLGRRMGCPYCKTPLEVAVSSPADEQQEAEAEEKQEPTRPIERKPMVFRQLRDEDVALTSELEYADEYSHRLLPFEAPEWDIAPDSDPQGDGDPDRPQPPRTKRPLTRREHNFRIVKITILSVALATTALIVYTALVNTVRVLRKDKQTVEEVTGDVRQKIKESAAQEEERITLNLTSDEEAAAAAVVNSLLEAETIEERLAHVRHPERVRPLMEEYYKRPDTRTEWPEGKVIRRGKSLDDGRYFIRLAVDFGEIGFRIFVVEQTKDHLKVDWEISSGYQPMPFEEFTEQRPPIPVMFRVKMKPSDYYNFQYVDSDKFFAVELSYPTEPDFKLIGYVDRSRPWAPELINRIREGETPSVIVELQFPAGEILDAKQVEVVSLIAPSWFL